MKTPWEYAATGNEHSHQVALFMWAAIATRYGHNIANVPEAYTNKDFFAGLTGKNEIPQLKRLFAINNAVGRNSAIHGARNAAEGVKSGVPDICLPVPMLLSYFGDMDGAFAGLYIELKRPDAAKGKKGVQSAAQIDWQNYLNEAGYKSVVCYGWEEARDAILKYLGKL